MHIVINGKARWLSLPVTKGIGKDAINIGNLSGELAKGIRYLFDTMTGLGVKGDDVTTNTLSNVIVRDCAEMVKTALTSGTGKPTDTFYLWFPNTAESVDSAFVADKWTACKSATRAQLVAIADSVIKVKSVLSPAETEADKIALAYHKTGEAVKVLADIPAIGDKKEAGKTGRGKKSGAVISI